MSETLSKEQLIQKFADAYEQVITVITNAEKRGVTSDGGSWGPRETMAHLAGWEVMATKRIPAFTTGGMEVFDFPEEVQENFMNDTINAAFVALGGEQPLAALSGILRQAYQRVVGELKALDEKYFQPGEYVYERTVSAIDHCQEHSEPFL